MKEATNSSSVAFPQPVELTPSILATTCTLTTGFLTALLLASISPNLWLVGGGFGALYGNEVAEGYNKLQQMPMEEQKEVKPTSIVSKITIKVRQI